MRTMEFRDGEHEVHDHVYEILRGVRTWELTYEQAVQQAHTQLMRTELERAQRDLLRSHFKGQAGGNRT